MTLMTINFNNNHIHLTDRRRKHWIESRYAIEWL